MTQFYSEYNASMSRYEKSCREASASDGEARAASRKSVEDSLVEGGEQAIAEYEALLEQRSQKVSCFADYDYIVTGRAIARRARARLNDSLKS